MRKVVHIQLTILCFLILLISGCVPVNLKTYIERMTGFEDVIYVCITEGNDDNRGMVDEPLATIQAGIDKAYSYIKDNLSDTVEVHVAVGTYEVNDEAEDYINMIKGVSLYGGYSLNFEVRDPEVYVTTIVDKSTNGEDTSAVRAYDGITEATVLDGFTIQGAILETEGGWSNALDIERASPTITNNTIIGGYAPALSLTIAIDAYDSASPLIEGNTIIGGTSSGNNCGVIVTKGSNAVVKNNTIAGGTSEWSCGIVLIEGSTPEIENNIIFSMATGSGYCIYESDTNTSNAASIHNNTLWDMPDGVNTVLYRMYDNNNYDSMGTVNALSHTSGNWDAAPLFVDIDGDDNDISTIEDNDWNLTGSSPKEVRQGGIYGLSDGWNYNTDRDEVTRII